MTFHKYPEEWRPEISFEELKSEKGQFYLTTQIAVNGYCLVKGCSTEKDTVLRSEFKIVRNIRGGFRRNRLRSTILFHSYVSADQSVFKDPKFSNLTP